ncbi:MAG: histidine kinase, partial [Bacteroidota bacterium]
GTYYFNLGTIQETSSEYDSALQSYKAALNGFVKSDKHTEMIIKSYNAIGKLHHTLGHIDSLFFYSRKALALAELQQDSTLIAGLKDNLASYYSGQGMYEKALEIRFENLQYYEQIDDKESISLSKLNIGNSLIILKRFEEAYHYLESGTKMAEATDFLHYAAFGYDRLSSISYSQKKYGPAIENCKKAVAIYLKLDDPYRIWHSYSSLVNIYLKTEKWSRARSLAYENLQYLKKLKANKDFNYYRALSYLELAYAHAGMGEKGAAGNYLNKVENIPIDELSLIVQKEIHNYREISYKKLGAFEKAYQALKQYNVVNDSLTEKTIEGKILALETQFQTKKKEQEIENLQKTASIQSLQLDKKNNQIVIYGLIVILLMVLSGGGFLYFRQQKIRKDKSSLELEQRFLRSQLNPHFIFNSMGAIQQFLYSQRPEKANDYLAMFSRLMRQILEHSREAFIPLSEEIDMLTNYLELQKNRFSEEFDYQIRVDEELDMDNMGIPPMFAQPFIENALEHGLFRTNKENKVVIHFKYADEQTIQMEIIDSGIGIAETKVPSREHTSLATKITHERIEKMRVTYKTNLGMQTGNITNEEGAVKGYRVSLTLPSQVMVA